MRIQASRCPRRGRCRRLPDAAGPAQATLAAGKHERPARAAAAADPAGAADGLISGDRAARDRDIAAIDEHAAALAGAALAAGPADAAWDLVREVEEAELA